MSKYTPAPWAVQKAEDCMGRKLDDMVRWVITADDHDLWISTGPTWDPEHAEESEANARLIAAAPELLMRITGLIAAAEYLQVRVVETRGANCMDNLDVAIDEARAAIAKATGD